MNNDRPLAALQRARDAMLENVTAIVRADPRVTAAWLFGSLGRGDADALSDIDVMVVVEDRHMAEVAASRREYAARAGDPLLVIEAPQNAPPGGAYLLVMYSGTLAPVYVDWSWQPQSNALVPPDATLLFDRVGLPAADPSPSAAARSSQQSPAQSHDFFWGMVPFAAKFIARGQAWTALSMLQMLWRTLEGVRHELGLREKRDYRDAPPFSPADRATEQLAALRLLVKEMELLRPELNGRGISLPSSAAEQIYGYLNLVARISLEAEQDTR